MREQVRGGGFWLARTPLLWSDWLQYQGRLKSMLGFFSLLFIILLLDSVKCFAPSPHSRTHLTHTHARTL